MKHDIYGAARIGRSGKATHTAVKYAGSKFVQCLCGCPGTSSNQATVTVFFAGAVGNCKRSFVPKSMATEVRE